MSSVNVTQASLVVESSSGEVGPSDAVWILTSAFIIFTMISGFGLVESGKDYFREALLNLRLKQIREAVISSSPSSKFRNL